MGLFHLTFDFWLRSILRSAFPTRRFESLSMRFFNGLEESFTFQVHPPPTDPSPSSSSSSFKHLFLLLLLLLLRRLLGPWRS